MKNSFLIIIISILSSVLSIYAYHQFFAPKPQVINYNSSAPAKYTSFSVPQAAKNYMTTAPTSFIGAANKVTTGVVNIRTIQKGKGNFDDFWGVSGVSSGSGVIISGDGYIVTNYHVVENASEIEVTLNDNRSLTATMIGNDPSTDLALIKIKGEGYPYIEFGNSDSVQIGEWVLAVGNPFNLTSTVTAGIVSAKGRNINILEGAYKIESFIQTDAAVNPGNSGGALVNTNGELIGINTAIITESGRYEGYSFAVPANLVNKIVADLKDFGIVQRGFLGVVIRDVTEDIAERLELDLIEGIYISEINSGSAAEKAGLKEGDVIIAINNVGVNTTPALQEQVARYRPGDNITVSYIRKGTEGTVPLTLRNKSNSTILTTKKDVRILDRLGLELRELTDEEEKKLEVTGVKVVSVKKGSKIDKANIDPNFIITKINGVDVNDIATVITEIQRAENRVMLKGVYENAPGEYYFAFSK